MAKELMKKWGRSIGKRLKEPSSWAGLGVLAMLLGVDADKVQAVVHIAGVMLNGADVAGTVAAVGAAAAVFLPEKKRHDAA